MTNAFPLAVFQTADKLVRTFAEQIFYTGFIHADPHPGNGEITVIYMALFVIGNELIHIFVKN